VEHVDIVTTCSTIKFTVMIFAVRSICVSLFIYKLCCLVFTLTFMVFIHSTYYESIMFLGKANATSLIAEIINGNTPKAIFGSSLSPGIRSLCLLVWFSCGPVQKQAAHHFEVISFSHCRNINGEPTDFGEIPSPRAIPTCVFRCNFMGPCQKQAVYQFEVAIGSAVAEYGNPKLWKAPFRLWPRPLLYLMSLYGEDLNCKCWCSLRVLLKINTGMHKHTCV